MGSKKEKRKIKYYHSSPRRLKYNSVVTNFNRKKNFEKTSTGAHLTTSPNPHESIKEKAQKKSWNIYEVEPITSPHLGDSSTELIAEGGAHVKKYIGNAAGVGRKYKKGSRILQKYVKEPHSNIPLTVIKQAAKFKKFPRFTEEEIPLPGRIQMAKPFSKEFAIEEAMKGIYRLPATAAGGIIGGLATYQALKPHIKKKKEKKVKYTSKFPSYKFKVPEWLKSAGKAALVGAGTVGTFVTADILADEYRRKRDKQEALKSRIQDRQRPIKHKFDDVEDANEAKNEKSDEMEELVDACKDMSSDEIEEIMDNMDMEGEDKEEMMQHIEHKKKETHKKKMAEPDYNYPDLKTQGKNLRDRIKTKLNTVDIAGDDNSWKKKRYRSKFNESSYKFFLPGLSWLQKGRKIEQGIERVKKTGVEIPKKIAEMGSGLKKKITVKAENIARNMGGKIIERTGRRVGELIEQGSRHPDASILDKIEAGIYAPTIKTVSKSGARLAKGEKVTVEDVLKTAKENVGGYLKNKKQQQGFVKKSAPYLIGGGVVGVGGLGVAGLTRKRGNPYKDEKGQWTSKEKAKVTYKRQFADPIKNKIELEPKTNIPRIRRADKIQKAKVLVKRNILNGLPINQRLLKTAALKIPSIRYNSRFPSYKFINPLDVVKSAKKGLNIIRYAKKVPVKKIIARVKEGVFRRHIPEWRFPLTKKIDWEQAKDALIAGAYPVEQAGKKISEVYHKSRLKKAIDAGKMAASILSSEISPTIQTILALGTTQEEQYRLPEFKSKISSKYPSGMTDTVETAGIPYGATNTGFLKKNNKGLKRSNKLKTQQVRYNSRFQFRSPYATEQQGVYAYPPVYDPEKERKKSFIKGALGTAAVGVTGLLAHKFLKKKSGGSQPADNIPNPAAKAVEKAKERILPKEHTISRAIEKAKSAGSEFASVGGKSRTTTGQGFEVLPGNKNKSAFTQLSPEQQKKVKEQREKRRITKMYSDILSIWSDILSQGQKPETIKFAQDLKELSRFLEEYPEKSTVPVIGGIQNYFRRKKAERIAYLSSLKGIKSKFAKVKKGRGSYKKEEAIFNQMGKKREAELTKHGW